MGSRTPKGKEGVVKEGKLLVAQEAKVVRGIVDDVIISAQHEADTVIGCGVQTPLAAS